MTTRLRVGTVRRCVWLACFLLLPHTATAQAPRDIEHIRAARLLGALAEAQQMAEQHLTAGELRPADRVALHLELARIHDRYGLHQNTRPVAEALEHVEAAARAADDDAGELLAAVALARAEMWYRAEMRERTFAEAARHAHQALDLYRQLGDRHGEAEAVHRLGLIALQRRSLDTARAHFEKSRDLDIAAGARPFFQGEYERHIAFVSMFAGDAATAIPHLERSLALRRASGAIDASMFAANTLASALVAVGRAEEARAPLLYAVTVADALASPVGRARNGLVAGRLYAALRDADAARIAFEHVLQLGDSLGAHSLVTAAKAALDSLSVGH
jgi:tetratricopeptide (TPR) repeat protein